MVEWANSIADNIGEDYPEEALKNGDALYAWITANKDRRIFKPTEKQIAFAENIALAMGGEIPDELRDNAKALSAWIDDHKDALGTEPTEKQLNAAEKIAERKGIELPEECRTDRKAMSAWLDKNMDRRDDTPVPSGKKKGKSNSGTLARIIPDIGNRKSTPFRGCFFFDILFLLSRMTCPALFFSTLPHKSY